MERLKLKARIVEKYGSTSAFAKKYGMTTQSVRNVLRGSITPKGMALEGWLSALDISESETAVFFAREVAKTQR
jgi:transcriptional regulator with XRE-family HTH domain